MATDYDEARPEIVEATEKNLHDVKEMDAPTAKSVQSEMEEVDFTDGLDLPGEIVSEELSVEVVPQRKDEFVCPECFTIRHKSQATELDGQVICRDCELEFS